MAFPTAEQFPKQTTKFVDIPIGIYRVLEITNFNGKFGVGVIADIQNESGETFKTLLPQRMGDDVSKVITPCFIKHDGKRSYDNGKSFWVYAILEQ